ncbi:AEC family transporter [Collinsella tanakaei]|uniref:AEC family transporter n=1 Tax=Collinsella tanakaei TaxID=626935 RepID=UPI0025A3194B|nr:AEC family transporter [Collinsella tanakaei]MDM8299602.1 AEC family transporter [Collinsella tanakaei]
MGFIDTALTMVTLAIPIIIGYAAHKLGFMGGEFDSALSKLVINITLPCMILVSVCDRELPAAEVLLQLLGLSAVGYVIAVVSALVVPRLMCAPESGAYSFVIAFGNVGFIGFPVLGAVLGPDAVLYAAIANIPWYILSSSAGVLMISGIPEGGAAKAARESAKRLLSPMLGASVVVLAMALAGVNDLGVLGDGLSNCGAFTTPAALLICGSSLANYSAREMVTNWRAYVACAMRLVGVPLLLLCAFRGIAPTQLTLAVIVLGQAMPVATNGILYCLMYGVDAKPVMQGMFLSVFASIVTIPLMALLVA